MTSSPLTQSVAPNKPPAILSLIGHTPLVEITRLDTGPCQLFVKLENQNPTGSIKDRVALAMIEAAERDGTTEAGRHGDRGDRRQHRPRARPHRGRKRLSHHPRHPRQDVAGKNRPHPRARRRSAPDAIGRDPRSSGILPGCGRETGGGNSRRVLRQPVRQPGQSARPRDKPPARRFGSKWNTTSTRS